MTVEQKDLLSELLNDKNFLGAAQYLRELELEKAERSARMGAVVSAVIQDLGRARSGGDRERVVYLRSVLAWLLKEYPGLASIYREQLRIATGSGDIFPEFARGVRNMQDVFSGKKTVQEGMEDAAEPMEGFAEQAGEFIKDGLNQFGSFFSKMNENMNREGSSRNSGTKNGTSQTAEDSKSSWNGDDEESRPVDINIEDADDPLPHDIHDADGR